MFSIAGGQSTPGVNDLIIYAQVTTDADSNFLGITGVNVPYGNSQAQMRQALIDAIKAYMSDVGFAINQNDTLFLLGI